VVALGDVRGPTGCIRVRRCGGREVAAELVQVAADGVPPVPLAEHLAQPVGLAQPGGGAEDVADRDRAPEHRGGVLAHRVVGEGDEVGIRHALDLGGRNAEGHGDESVVDRPDLEYARRGISAERRKRTHDRELRARSLSMLPDRPEDRPPEVEDRERTAADRDDERCEGQDAAYAAAQLGREPPLGRPPCGVEPPAV
jgi:hypothetical protein